MGQLVSNFGKCITNCGTFLASCLLNSKEIAYTSQSIRKMGEVSAVQSLKWWKFTNFQRCCQIQMQRSSLILRWYQPIDLPYQPAHPKCLVGRPRKNQTHKPLRLVFTKMQKWWADYSKGRVSVITSARLITKTCWIFRRYVIIAAATSAMIVTISSTLHIHT